MKSNEDSNLTTEATKATDIKLAEYWRTQLRTVPHPSNMFGIGSAATESLPPPLPSPGIYKKKAFHSSLQREPLNIPESPPKLPRRPPKKGNKRETLSDIARRVPVEVIRPYFNYPLRKAAEALCISVTTLKRLCRRHGVKRWPHRQLSGLNRAVSHLEAKRLALKDGLNDPIIADQLRQLYSRRDIIIDLAFMSDDEATAARGNMHGVKPEYLSRPQSVASSQPLDYGSSCAAGQSFCHGVVSPAASVIPWWHRDTTGDGFGDNGASHGMGGEYNAYSGAPHEGRGRVDAGRQGKRVNERYIEHGTMSENVHRGAGGSAGFIAMPSYRASSVLVRRLPGMPTGPPSFSPPLKMERPAPSPPSSFKLPSPGTLLAGIPSSHAGAGGPGSAAGNRTPGQNAVRRRSMSPMTISANKPTVSRTGAGGGVVVKPPPPHYIPLPAHHPSDSMDKQIADLSNLNDILFGPEYHGAEMMDPNSMALMINAPPCSGGISGVHPRGGAGASCGEGGRLPSLAGLVSAGALLSGGKHKQWNRACRPNSAVLVRGGTGEV